MQKVAQYLDYRSLQSLMLAICYEMSLFVRYWLNSNQYILGIEQVLRPMVGLITANLEVRL